MFCNYIVEKICKYESWFEQDFLHLYIYMIWLSVYLIYTHITILKRKMQ